MVHYLPPSTRAEHSGSSSTTPAVPRQDCFIRAGEVTVTPAHGAGEVTVTHAHGAGEVTATPAPDAVIKDGVRAKMFDSGGIKQINKIYV